MLGPLAAALLFVSGCTSGDRADRSTTDAADTTPPSGLCVRLGNDLLRKLAPNFDTATWSGMDRACTRMDTGPGGALLDITLHDEPNYTDTECASEKIEATEFAVWLSADELTDVGEQACGYTVEGPGNRVDVWIVARRGPVHVRISYSRHGEELAAAKKNVKEVANAALALA
ncbi:hypothetical protein GCM10009557_09840 [Virgisporangium ochraceum]|uniref:DUF3558 domain-containing protein n=1 Tax=Virgisporangium ochraceum TaxID=65505 RepID=A0A8J3ZWG7_9ACTN|nr:hypothetical protein Voc01_062260 [Virgisporangium ochraceum]